MKVGVVIPAAGDGTRMGGVRKPFLEIASESVLLRAIRPFLTDDRVTCIAVALSTEDAATPPEWLTSLDARIHVVEGGATRGESVSRALRSRPGDLTVIAVHDAARPLVTADVVVACIDLAATGTGAVAGTPAVDTMKVVDAGGVIVKTPDRSTLWHAHTPQVFPAELLRAAYASGGLSATDDAAVVEGVGGVVQMVEDGGLNLKITRSEDMVVAEALIRARAERT